MTQPDTNLIAPPQMVWIATRKADYNYSEPLAVFNDHRIALVFVSGARAAYGDITLHELEMNNVEKHL
jgi:hypothetical protein